MLLPLMQGFYFLSTGVWPLLHMRSFTKVTGPKVDEWLVKTVGVLVAVAGATLIVAARRKEAGAAIALLGAGSAAGLGTIDVVYALRGRISKIYLADALGEAALVALWLRQRRGGVAA